MWYLSMKLAGGCMGRMVDFPTWTVDLYGKFVGKYTMHGCSGYKCTQRKIMRSSWAIPWYLSFEYLTWWWVWGQGSMLPFGNMFPWLVYNDPHSCRHGIRHPQTPKNNTIASLPLANEGAVVETAIGEGDVGHIFAKDRNSHRWAGFTVGRIKPETSTNVGPELGRLLFFFGGD